MTRRTPTRRQGRASPATQRLQRIQSGKTLWNALLPAHALGRAAEATAGTLDGRPEGEAQAAGRLFSSLARGPMPMEAIASTVLAGKSEAEAARLQPWFESLGERLNDVLFERMGELCEEHFGPGPLDEALAFANTPLWRSWMADGAAYAAALHGELTRRWREERVDPLIARYTAALEAGGALPELAAVVGDDALAQRLLDCYGVAPVPTAWLAQQLQRWEREDGAAALRARGLWARVTAQVLDGDGWWQAQGQAFCRGSRTDAELARLIAYYGSATGRRFVAALPRVVDSMEGWVASEAMKDVFLSALKEM